ncbi:MAG: hypothetical protein ACRCVT_15120 [Leadbetterella sp.]
MKKTISIIVISFALASCAGTAPSTSRSGTNNSAFSPEAQAKNLTDQMAVVLELTEEQIPKVFNLNLVNAKLTRALRIDDTSGKNSQKQSYQNEMQKVLTEKQFPIFLEKFLN